MTQMFYLVLFRKGVELPYRVARLPGPRMENYAEWATKGEILPGAYATHIEALDSLPVCAPWVMGAVHEIVAMERVFDSQY